MKTLGCSNQQISPLYQTIREAENRGVQDGNATPMKKA